MMLNYSLLQVQKDKKKCLKAWREELYVKQKRKCMYCGYELQLTLLECDHKVPFAVGGSNTKKNYQLLCKFCNGLKGVLTDKQFRSKFKATGIPQTQILPKKPIPHTKFQEISKQASKKKVAQNKKKKASSSWF